MLDFREKYMKGALGIAVTSANNCPHESLFGFD
jgi:hypothetical protein